MSSRVTTYNPRQVTCSLDNSHIVSGFADDSFISVEPQGDGTSVVQGCDGEVARSIDPSNMYTVKLSLLQNSETNAWLQSKYDQDKTDGGGTFSVAINDVLGAEKFNGAVAWVSKNASWARGKAQGNREWEITVADGSFT